MTEIYLEVSKLTGVFKKICYRYTKDKHIINEAVQELMLYFMQMNPDTLKSIYDKDGSEGITKYGYVALRRALLSPRSNFYYKYKKYYNNLDYYSTRETYDFADSGEVFIATHISNLPNQEDDLQWKKLEEIDVALEDFTWYDRQVFMLYYYEGNTLDSLAKKTGISRNSLFTTIDKVRKILKEKLNE
tara:strand:+ start:271 stop:834 length:564 start_codon:yes stop_codon:yes gene_type:complete